jgi:hypothetical protein
MPTQGDGEIELQFHNPESYEAAPELDQRWQDILMVRR